MFRKEMDKLGKKLRVVERECTDWKEKFDGSNDQVCYIPQSHFQLHIVVVFFLETRCP